jgi:predicted PolB exonuclease-like 3'-5' exonuclease
MPNHLIVWDIETVPDLRGFAAANGHDGKADHEVREAMGDKFPKHIYHSIIFVSVLWWPTAITGIGRSMPSGHRTSEIGPRKNS